jgi:nitrite reductase/ring-hydroxylating ferredoxin subunit/uncharacterized membrane protein
MGLRRYIIEAIERQEAIDAVDGPIRSFALKFIRNGPFKDGLSGTWLGHPLHPMLVAVPTGSWVGASVLDLTPGHNDLAARRLIGLGILIALPTALAGLSDWSDTSGAEQRVGSLHAGLNLAALSLYSASWLRRLRSRGSETNGQAIALALMGGTLLGAAGYLGGHLAYALGVGTDANAFETGPEEWQVVPGEIMDGHPHDVSVAGVSLLFVEREDHLRALANRCSHRGGPLSDGEVKGGCIVCPWHGSKFDLASGKVRRGPATQPQPLYETRVIDGSIEVRRNESRSLRKNAVRAR